jgi:signal transduction histidine kinase
VEVCEAISAADAALLIVDAAGDVVFASEAARTWVTGDRYPWPIEAGVRRITREDGQVLEQLASPTEWSGADAYLVNLRVPAEIPASPREVQADGEMLRQASEAALSYVETASRQSLWMADVLRSTLDLHRVMSGDLDLQPEDVDVLETAQQVTREERSLAMNYGLPLRTVSDRNKAISYADRNLVHILVHRLVVDAVHAAGTDGVEVTVEVEKKYSSVKVAWTESSHAVAPVASACVGLGQQIVQHIATLMDGESHHERTPNGRHTFAVHLPCRTADCDT